MISSFYDGHPHRGSAEYQLGYHAGYQRGRADAENGRRWPCPATAIESLQAENEKLRKRIEELQEDNRRIVDAYQRLRLEEDEE